MATNSNDPNELISSSFSDFPEDVQLCVLSFLTPSEIANFACTSKRFVSLCRNDAKLWFSMCDRRWGSKTQIKKWGSGKISYRQLYRTLSELENLIGFWRRCGQTKNITTNSPPPLIFFEWGSFFIIGSRISPSKNGTYDVIRAPFLWISITRNGGSISFIDLECRPELSENLVNNSGDFGCLENELVPVNVSFMGKSHVVVEENLGFSYSNPVQRVLNSGNVRGEECGVVEEVAGSPPDRLMSEIYQYFANRTSPGGNGAARRQRRREKERQGRRKWEPEHFVKIENCSPTASRPLQGLWKGICDDMNLDFYLVVYDDIGGIACRRVGDASKPFSGYDPVFWTSNTTFIESPLPFEEEYIYNSRVHLRPPPAADDDHGHPSSDNEAVSHILHINSSYDLVIADLAGTIANSWLVEGRIWQYENGTFGFGFLRNHYVTDLKHIAWNGCLLDAIEFSNS
ncbi:unnamed protein product [Ilex paraguariensis]|uniref:F-box protein n=1 Tax=Ilex paraguariensis TaxID=185542 RepID=A0ABC8SES7_9AQUA